MKPLIDKPTVRPGAPLLEISEKRYWIELGHARFQAFCEAEGVRPTRARILRDVYKRYFRDAGLDLDQSGDTDPELLHLVRGTVTPKRAMKIAHDAQRVTAGKLDRTEFARRWASAPRDEDLQPPRSKLLDALTEENEWEGPASRDSRVVEVEMWLESFKPEQLDELVERLARRRGSNGFSPERVLKVLEAAQFKPDQWSRLLKGLQVLRAFHLAQNQPLLVDLLATLGRKLAPEDRRRLVSMLAR